MGKQIKDILESLLLPTNSSWEISEVEVNDITEEISVTVRYTDTVIRIDGTEYPIYDFRHDRSWRHLDLWQYKTFIHARVPRYKTAEGIRSVSVPWADPISRLTSLMGNKR